MNDFTFDKKIIMQLYKLCHTRRYKYMMCKLIINKLLKKYIRVRQICTVIRIQKNIRFAI